MQQIRGNFPLFSLNSPYYHSCKHIKNAIEEEETELSSVAKFATTASDENKRIAATMFLYFLNKNGLLFKDGLKQIDDNTLYIFLYF
jgi:hypothetical protein